MDLLLSVNWVIKPLATHQTEYIRKTTSPHGGEIGNVLWQHLIGRVRRTKETDDEAPQIYGRI